MGDASADEGGMNVLPMLIEQRKFASGLRKATQQIAALRRIGLATQSLSQRCVASLWANLWANLGFLGCSHAQTFCVA